MLGVPIAFALGLPIFRVAIRARRMNQRPKENPGEEAAPDLVAAEK
jgi:hypothetical protein